jgi:hypothetical protein
VDREVELKKGSEYIKFICEVPNSTVDEIFTYNEILDHIEKDNIDIESDTEQLTSFIALLHIKVPFVHHVRITKVSMYNVSVEWETGQTTFEPLEMIATDDTVTCAQIARENNLLDTAGWKCLRRIAKSEKKLKG